MAQSVATKLSVSGMSPRKVTNAKVDPRNVMFSTIKMKLKVDIDVLLA